MDYDLLSGGRIAGEASDGGSLQVDPRVQASRGELVTFQTVEERMKEAVDHWGRMPDRESSWQHVKAAWPDILRHGWRVNTDGEHDEREAVQEPKRPALARYQIEAMVEASEWLRFAQERDRRLVAVVLAAKVRQGRRLKWEAIWVRLGRGAPGPDGLRMRYTRAISDIAKQLNARKG